MKMKLATDIMYRVNEIICIAEVTKIKDRAIRSWINKENNFVIAKLKNERYAFLCRDCSDMLFIDSSLERCMERMERYISFKLEYFPYFIYDEKSGEISLTPYVVKMI